MPPFEYRGEHLREVAFPLGGIGTGCVSLEGRGALRDWEIFGRPNKGKLLEMTFAALWYRPEGEEPRTRVLQGPRQKDFVGDGPGFWSYGHGQIRQQGDGLPHFSEASFRGTFPFGYVTLVDPDCPLEVVVTGWSPFVPLDSRSSGFPVACLEYEIVNRGTKRVECTLAFNMTNPVGLMAGKEVADQAHNEYREDDPCRGFSFTNDRFEAGDPHHGTAALATSWTNITYLPRWLDGSWFDSLHHFWNLFTKQGELDARAPNPAAARQAASLGLRVALEPGEFARLPIAIAWSFPTSEKYWGSEDEGRGLRSKPWYATQWPSAWDAASEFFSRFSELRSRTKAFESALHDSTLPPEIIETVGATSTVLRTPTCLRLEDGTFWAWEGCSPAEGCCAGSCTHVWNYALTQAYLFPDLQRSMRRSEYRHSFAPGAEGERGAVAFRIPLPLAAEPKFWHAASDGQLGGVVQLYRDWQLSADDAYLQEMWPAAQRALEYAWIQWDCDKDGLVDGDQHNTYDINFQGPNPLTQFFYLAALRAGEEIARCLGQDNKAREYRLVYEAGRAKTVEALWNGEFFEQVYDCFAPGAEKYQHGRGCLTDQVFGQWAATVGGLGDLVDPTLIRSALLAIYRHNFRSPLRDHANMQRIYAMADEPALLLCSWPNGGRPDFPFPYSDESWTGIDYQVASHMIANGLEEEGLQIVRAARERYDGRRRNPYNEFECGSHYARPLSAYGLILAYTGFRLNRSSGEVSANTIEGMRSFFSTGTAWGWFEIKDGKPVLHTVEGDV